MDVLTLLLALVLQVPSTSAVPAMDPPPVRIGVVGLVHGHVGWILGREDFGDVEVVGVAEPDHELAMRMAKRFGFDMEMVYPSVDEMLDATQPEAITVFSNIYDHLAATEAAATRGVHVMVEKPLAISLEHAQKMKSVADSAGIHLLTNYETTWYPSVHYAKESLASIGELRKIVVRDGHPGPIEIGVGEEFSSWLLTEEKNGGGAITDFGCYGANLITWLTGGLRPTSVTAVTQIFKPDPPYGMVDDEATIIVTYPFAQGIIQASWNWPFNRKDMDVYGTEGFVYAVNQTDGVIRLPGTEPVEFSQLPQMQSPHHDPFAFLAAVVRGDIDPEGSLSSLSINMIAMEILDAAIRSSKSGKTIHLSR
ncbi:MAG: Gfo/Idh/MocA family oxidoreductase [Bacteroidetes bacterium]|nr:Gfo/Idh/MocA family oxidoreductase [Bacteroidota bacterium]MCY4205545.1 Gfo/Idh/MocA family oxidoreductase [Bacteroidota bacterium]